LSEIVEKITDEFTNIFGDELVEESIFIPFNIIKIFRGGINNDHYNQKKMITMINMIILISA
jgi:hypothetical protein